MLIFLMCYISACGDDDNGVPIANAGPDQMVTAGAMVTLDGSGSSDPNGDVLGYSWSADSNNPSEVGLRSKTTVSPTFTAPNTAGAYTFTLVVDDGVAHSSPDMVIITVDTSNNNTAPVANAGPDQTVNAGATVTLDGSGSSDSDKDALTYSWSVLSDNPSAITLSDTMVAGPTFTAPNTAGAYKFVLVVNDGTVNSPTDTVVITSNTSSNAAPTADAGPDQTVNAGATVTLDGSGSSDSDRDNLTYNWSVLSDNPSAITLSDTTVAGPTFTAPNTAGAYKFVLVVNDGTVNSPTDTVQIVVEMVSPPTVATSRVSRNDVTFEGVTFGSSTFVAVGYYGGVPSAVNSTARGTINYSSDGMSWTEVSSSVTGGNVWYDVIFADNKFIAVGDSGSVATSIDGITWSEDRTSDNEDTRYWLGIAYDGSSTYFFVSRFGYYATSNKSALTTVTTAQGRFGTITWQAVTYGNNHFVAVGKDKSFGYYMNNALMEDGDIGGAAVQDNQGNFSSVTYGTSGFIATVSSLNNRGIHAVSTDGENWTIKTNDNVLLRGGSYVNNEYVMLGGEEDEGDVKIYFSSDTNITPSEAIVTEAEGLWQNVTYGNDKYVVVGEESKILIMTRN